MRAVLAITINLVLIALLFLYQSHAYAAILLGVSLLTWFFYFLWRRQNLVEQRVTDKIRGQNILMPIEHVMFRARESSGYSQTSGMGFIVLTDTFLYFELVLLDMIITIPLSNLVGAEFVYRLKGVSPGRKMLRIIFNNENGELDSIAINVKDMEGWRKAITNIANS